MKKFAAFLQLIRYKNLLFIGITQLFFYTCVILPAYQKYTGGFPLLNQNLFHWILVASILIAGAGYIINDYFDLNIDRINKPSKMVVDKEISRRWAMMLHLILSVSGLIITSYVSIELNNFLLIHFKWNCSDAPYGFTLPLLKRNCYLAISSFLCLLRGFSLYCL